MVSLNGAGAIARCWNAVACFVGIPRHGRRKNDWLSQVYGGAERGARERFGKRLGTEEILSRSGSKGFARIFLVGLLTISVWP